MQKLRDVSTTAVYAAKIFGTTPDRVISIGLSDDDKPYGNAKYHIILHIGDDGHFYISYYYYGKEPSALGRHKFLPGEHILTPGYHQLKKVNGTQMEYVIKKLLEQNSLTYVNKQLLGLR